MKLRVPRLDVCARPIRRPPAGTRAVVNWKFLYLRPLPTIPFIAMIDSSNDS